MSSSRSTSRLWVGLALVAASAALGVGCDVNVDAPEDQVLTVYVSGAQRGPSGPAVRDIADGARMALAEVDGEIGGRAVEAKVLDSSSKSAGSTGRAGWDQARTAANARKAIEDSTTIAYIGEFESGATRVSLPITNEAGVLHVSAASTAVDLARSAPGSSELPLELQATGERTFARVIPDDDEQAVAAAVWAETLGASSVIAVSDGSEFGDLLQSAFELGASLRDLQISRRPNADALFYGGTTGTRVLGSISEDSSIEQPLASDALLPIPPGEGPAPSFAAAEPLRLTAAAQATEHLPAAARSFLSDFRATYERRPGPYAAYGYEAMAAILDSIERASDGSDRTAVRDAFFAINLRESILGSYSIDEVGNTTLGRISGYLTEPGDPAAGSAQPDQLLETR